MQRFVRFWRQWARPFAPHYVFGILFLVATNWLTVAIPGYVEEAIDALGHGGGPDAAARWSLAILIAGLGVIVVRTLSRTLFFNPGRTLEQRVKDAMFDRLLQLPRRFYDRMRPGEIISRGTNDTNWMRALVGFASLQLFNVVFVFVFTLGKMFASDWRLTLWCVVPLTGAAVFLRANVGRMFGLTVKLQGEVAKLSDRILETYNGASVVQAFAAQPGAMRRFDEVNERFLKDSVSLARVRSWALPVVSVVGNLCVVIVLWVGGLRVADGKMDVGALAAFIVYLNILVGGLMNFGFVVNAIQRGWISMGRVDELLDAPLETAEVKTSLPVATGSGRALGVHHLTFAFGDGGQPVLSDVTFDIAAGETVGIFGLTGAGKSVLLSLLARIQEPPAGAITVDGVDIRDVPVRDYRAEVAYVPQEAYLFSTTLRENIALAAPAGQRDDARVEAAARDAALTDDLRALSAGLDTEVGERGITVSGGQRQRAALARAFYRDFRLLLLDDVMSAVDHATEKQLVDAVYRRGAGATTLIVSHRCSVLARARRILVLDGGRLVTSGTHAELARQDGPYAQAWKLQQAAEAIEAVPA